MRGLLGDRVVEVRIDAADAADARPRAERRGRNPQDLFAAYLAEENIEDPRLVALFATLLDEELSR